MTVPGRRATGAPWALLMALAACALGGIPYMETVRTFPTRYEPAPSAWPDGGIPVEALIASVEMRWAFMAAFALAFFGLLLATCVLLAVWVEVVRGRPVAAEEGVWWRVGFAPVAGIYVLSAAFLMAGAVANGGPFGG